MEDRHERRRPSFIHLKCTRISGQLQACSFEHAPQQNIATIYPQFLLLPMFQSTTKVKDLIIWEAYQRNFMVTLEPESVKFQLHYIISNPHHISEHSKQEYFSQQFYPFIANDNQQKPFQLSK